MMLPWHAHSCLRSQDNRVEQLRELAQQFGAGCVDAGAPVDEANSVTHVVALTPESAEAAWAHQSGRGAVRPAWLLCCAHTWYRAREERLSVAQQ